VIYIGIGMVMGHEITHGFDNEGRLYDKDGNRVSWWTNETIDEFNKRKECIIQQYNNYTVTQINLQVFHSVFQFVEIKFVCLLFS
jgi:predicted metalloendopeptidase